jgi:adenylate cyclase
MDDGKRIAAIIRDYLARERISREQFAFKTKLGKSTVDKLLIGLFSDRTLSIIEGHTGLSLRTSHPPEQPAMPRAVLSGPDTPSIAVLPFTNMSGDPEQEYFADGITEDITTALSRLRWLFVIARNSTFTYKGRAVDVRQVALELAVRYVLEGSVRASSGRIRVTGQLVDAATGKHIWAGRYDRNLRDIFELQDEITGNVVASIEPRLYEEEGIRAASRPKASTPGASSSARWASSTELATGRTRRRERCLSARLRLSRPTQRRMPS